MDNDWMAKTIARKKTASRKAAAKKTASRGSQKRALVDTGTDARYVKRTATGRFKESDDVGRSLKTDRARTAKKTVKSGYGDQGDQRKKR
jgi:hypothetical protein